MDCDFATQSLGAELQTRIALRRKLPMKDLAATLEQAGFSAVRTYIESGNVVFRPPMPEAKRDRRSVVLRPALRTLQEHVAGIRAEARAARGEPLV